MSCVWETESRQALVSEVFDIEGTPVRVTHTPATVCLHCGEPVFSRDATERVRRMVHGEATPLKSIQMDLFAYQSSFLVSESPRIHPAIDWYQIPFHDV